jgi:hypothetical protein
MIIISSDALSHWSTRGSSCSTDQSKNNSTLKAMLGNCTVYSRGPD